MKKKKEVAKDWKAEPEKERSKKKEIIEEWKKKKIIKIKIDG